MLRVSELNTYSLNYSKVILIALLLSVLSLLLLKISWSIILIPFLLIPLFLYGEKTLIFYSIIASLSLTSTISVELRTIVQATAILILFYIFIKDYGADFSIYPKIPKQISILLILLFLSMIISTLFSDYIFLGIKEIIRLTAFLMIVYTFFGYLKKTKDIKLFLIALLASGLIYFANVFYNFAQNDFSLIELNVNELMKVEGNYVNVNGIGSFFVIIISLLLSYFILYKNNKKRFLPAILLVIFTIGLVITNSRAAILSVAISSLFLSYFYNKKKLIVISCVLLVLIPFLFIKPFSEYVDLYFRVERLTSGRDWIWETMVNIIKNNPVLGVGPAATRFEIFKNLPFMLGSPAEKYLLHYYYQIEFGHAHNFYLFFLTDMGILGLFTSLFLPYVFISIGFKTMKKFKNVNKEFYWLSTGITAAGIGLFIRGLFEWGNLISYGTLESDLPFWIIFIILIYLYQISGTEIIQNKSLF